jgi:hypothetical protein
MHGRERAQRRPWRGATRSQDLPLELARRRSVRQDPRAASPPRTRSAARRQQENVQLLVARDDPPRRPPASTANLAVARANGSTKATAGVHRRNCATTHVALLGSVPWCVLLLVLGFGLHHYVVRPTQRLNARPRSALAGGELTVDLPTTDRRRTRPARARRSAPMVEQLRELAQPNCSGSPPGSRTRWQRKTRHLEQALAELQEFAPAARPSRTARVARHAGRRHRPRVPQRDRWHPRLHRRTARRGNRRRPPRNAGR